MSEESIWTTDLEYIHFLNFLLKETSNVTWPMNISKLCVAFKKKYGFGVIKTLKIRIRFLGETIHKMTDIDRDARVKLIFALSLPMDNEFLRELQEDAEVRLDNVNRIFEYKKKEKGGLFLRGIHSTMNENLNETDDRMLECLAEHSKRTDKPFTGTDFLIAFSAPHPNEWNRYRRIKKQIYESPKFDEETKIRMLFVSGASVQNDVLEILRKNATVSVDEGNRITKYEANDGSLTLKGKCKLLRTNDCYWKKLSRKISVNVSVDEEEQEVVDLIKFFIEKCTDGQVNISKTCRDFQVIYKSSLSFSSLYSRILNYRDRIHIFDDLDTNTKVRQMFGLHTSVDSKFLKKLRQNAVVEVDDSQRIIRYEANDGSLKLQGKHSSRRKKKETRRENEIIDLSSDSEYDEYVEESSDSEEVEITTRSGRVYKKRCMDNYVASQSGSRCWTSLKSRKIYTGSEDVESSTSLPESEPISYRVKLEECSEDFSPESFKISNERMEEKPRLAQPKQVVYKVKEEPEDEEYSLPSGRGLEESHPFTEKKVPHLIETEGIVHEVKLENESIRKKRATASKSSKLSNKEIQAESHQIKLEPLDESELFGNDPEQTIPINIKDLKQEATEIAEGSNVRRLIMPLKNEGHTDQRKILEALHTLVVQLNLEILAKMQKAIRKMIRDSNKNNKKTPVKFFRISLKSLFYMVTDSTNHSPDKESTSLKEFLQFLKNAVIGLNLPSLIDYEQKLTEKIRELSVQDKFVGVISIRDALEMILNTIDT